MVAMFGALAVVSVSLEMPWTAAVFGTLAFCLVGHGV
jgi:hypothetical protein